VPDAATKPLSIALLLFLATCAAGQDQSQIASSPVSKPLGDAEVVCSATIVSTWRGGEISGPGSSGSSEKVARAEVDKVFKGRLLRTKVTFLDDRWAGPEELNNVSAGGANSVTLAPDLQSGVRYMLFLSSDSINGHEALGTYKLHFSVPLAPGAEPRLRLDASRIALAEQKREMVEEFVKAASFVLDSHGNAADAYDYFSYIYQLLGAETMTFVQKLLDSPDTRLRYFAADKLAQMTDESAVDPLLSVLNDPAMDPWMRSSAALDLDMLHATKALPDFERLATDDADATVRRAALLGLDHLGDCNADGVLKRALDDSVADNRRLAAQLLERFNAGKLCKHEVSVRFSTPPE
jgi:HEAT repeats